MQPDSADQNGLLDFHGRSAEVLVVDDEVPIAELLARMLQKLGHRAIIAVSAAEALDRFGQGSFDLVITDLMLPDCSGLQLARQLRAQRPDLAVVLTTGCPTHRHKAEAGAAGVQAILPKPFTLPVLQAALQRLAVGAGLA